MNTPDYKFLFWLAAFYCAVLLLLLVSNSVRISGMTSQHEAEMQAQQKACKKQMDVLRDAQTSNGQCSLFMCIGPKELGQSGVGSLNTQMPEHGAGGDQRTSCQQVFVGVQKHGWPLEGQAQQRATEQYEH